MNEVPENERLNEIRQDLITVKVLQAKVKGKNGKGRERIAYSNLLEILRSWEEASL